MERIYVTAAVGALLLAAAGALLVASRQPVAPGSSSAWSAGEGSIYVQSGKRPFSETPGAYGDPSPSSTSSSVLSGIIPSLYRDAQPRTSESSGEPTDQLRELLSLLSPSQSSSGGSEQSFDLSSIYTYLPSGLISTQQREPALSASQQALYEYANAAGAVIQGYERRHADTQAGVFEELFAARSSVSEQTRADARAVAGGLGDTGRELLALEDVPNGVAANHLSLAESYIEMEEKLLALIEAAQGEDAQLEAAIYTYNAAADGFAQTFVAIATFISVSDVPLSDTDPGSVFVFTQGL